MTNETNNSLVNLGDLAKPADTLIKAVSKAIGGIFVAHQIVRTAKAEAEAAIMKAKGEIVISDLQHRAMNRQLEEGMRHQQNMESITKRATLLLSENADASKIEDDWIINFFAKSRNVSNSDMQELWEKILAGEAENPGSFSKRTVNFLDDLDKFDAECFSVLCRYGWVIRGHITPLTFDTGEIYTKSSGNFFSLLTHLESVNLIKFSLGGGSFFLSDIPKNITAHYYNKPFPLCMPSEIKNDLAIGKVMLTATGLELASICKSEPVDGFFDYVKSKWSRYV